MAAPTWDSDAATLAVSQGNPVFDVKMVVIDQSGGRGDEARTQLLQEKVERKLDDLSVSGHEKPGFLQMLMEYHEPFSLQEGERGETDFLHMSVDTAYAPPKKQQMQRVPFAVRQEVARQLHDMQSMEQFSHPQAYGLVSWSL